MFVGFLTAILCYNSNIHELHPYAQNHEYPGVHLNEIKRFTQPFLNAEANCALATKNHWHYNRRLDLAIKTQYSEQSYREWKIEVEGRQEIWQWIKYLNRPCEPYIDVQTHINGKLWYLFRLRHALGEENYNAGIVPPPIPNYYFTAHPK